MTRTHGRNHGTNSVEYDLARWRAEALELRRALAQALAELSDVVVLVHVLDRRGPTDDRRHGYGSGGGSTYDGDPVRLNHGRRIGDPE
jgi:hypothetical protein